MRNDRRSAGGKHMKNKTIYIAAAVCLAAVIGMVLALLFTGGRRQTAEFTPPSFDAAAQAVREEAADGGAPEGLVILADHQTAGRGRRTHSFYSPEHTGLYMSLLLRPNIPMQDCLLITTAAAAATARAIEALTGQPARIKWVNDIFCGSRKVCGILTEATTVPGADRPNAVILGIGVNLAPPPGGFPPDIENTAGTLFPELPSAQTRRELLQQILTEFWSYYQNLQQKPFLEEYRRSSLVIGQPVRILQPGRDPENAVAVAVEDDFSLRVRLENGELRSLSSGDVSIRVRD